MCLGVTKSLVVDMAFLIESQTDEELPESILGVARFCRCDLKKFRRISKNGKAT